MTSSTRTSTRLAATLASAAILLLTLATPAAPTSEYDSVGPAASIEELTASPRYLAPLDAAVLRLYRAFFRREADVAGAIYWIDQHRNGASLEDLAWGFSNSDEFIADYGTGLGNAAFLDIVYPNVLGREPDPDGYAYWLGEMNNGLGQDGVVQWITANTEFVDRYPYAGKSEWVPLDLFLSPGEVDEATGVNEWSDTLTLAALGSGIPCKDRFSPAAAFAGRVSGFDPSVRPFATQTVHEFDTEAEAQAFIAAGQSLQATCGTIVDGTTYVETQTPMTLTTVATDQYFAVLITHEGDPADNGDILMVASVRFGRTVTTVGLMTKLNDSDTVPFQKLLGYVQDRADWIAPDGD
ncbi:MAG: DUF4214 domain-containing protein [Acidimicrobiales bacterium]